MIYDVAIVGAGPAGAAAAYALEQTDLNIILIDKEKFPRSKPCAGVLPPRIYSEVPIPDEIVERPLEGYRLFTASGRMVESRFPKNGLIVRRDRFDSYLVTRLNNGPELMRINYCKVNSDFVEISGDFGSLKTKVVLGADGVNSIVRKCTGCDSVVDKKNDMALAIQNEISLPSDVIQKNIGNFFEVYYTISSGYGWVSPLKDSVKVGIGTTSLDLKSNLKKVLDDFIHGDLLEDKVGRGKIVGSESHLIPMRGPFEKLASLRSLLCGDAGGFVFPGTGEGIYYAVKSGRVAADVVKEAFDKEKFDSEFLGSRYEEKLEENGLLSLRDVDFLERVLSSPDKAEQYVQRLDNLMMR